MKFQLANVILSACLLSSVSAFAPVHQAITSPSISTTSLSMAGMGMGGAAKSKKKGGGSNKKNKAPVPGAKFDVSKACLKSERLYDEIQKEQAKIDNADNDTFEYITAEYMITARIKPSQMKDMNIPGAVSISDWVPVSQLCLRRHVDEPGFDTHTRDCARVRTAVSYYCREISYMGSLGASIFKSIPRSSIEYAAEPVDSFYKFVHEDVIQGKNQDANNSNTMTKMDARNALELEEGCNDAGEIKRAYRKLTFKLHPDRLVGKNKSEEETKQAAEDFARVKLAYESMSSGVRGEAGSGKTVSWYESLGGRARTEFSGRMNLMPMDEAKEAFSAGKYRSAVCGLRPDTVMAFVTRNQAASR